MINLKPYMNFVEKILSDDKEYILADDRVGLSFCKDTNMGYIGRYDRSEDIVYVNLYAINFYVNQINEPYTIENFLIHELHHKYQYKCVSLYENNSKECADLDYARKCKESFDSYVTPEQDKDKYHMQFVELDAFAYTYAIMCLKYGKVDYLKPPAILVKNVEFNERVSFYQEFFSMR